MSPPDQDALASQVRLVYAVARKTTWLRTDDYRHDDVVSDGMLGLIRAARTWDETKGPWPTYASQLIRFAILDGFRSRDGRHGARPVVAMADLPAAPMHGTAEREARVDDADLLCRIWPRLTQREREAVVSAASGTTQQALADQWGVCPTRVRQVLSAMRRRLAPPDGVASQSLPSLRRA